MYETVGFIHTAQFLEVLFLIYSQKGSPVVSLCYCNHLWANHQNVDPDILSEVLPQRKVIPFLAHPALQVLCWLFFRP